MKHLRRSTVIVALLVVGLVVGACRTSKSKPADAETREDPRRLAVGIVLADGVPGSELAAPLEVLHLAGDSEVFTVAASRDAVRTAEGLRVVPDHAFADAPEIDVLALPGSDGDGDAVVAFARDRAPKARFVLASSRGVALLARSGSLEGRRCTTSAADVPGMRRAFPDVHVIDGLSFVRDGPLITSAGGVRAYDAALYLVEVLEGRDAARAVAKRLCIAWDLAGVPHIAP